MKAWGQWKDMGQLYAFQVRKEDNFFRFHHWGPNEIWREDVGDAPIWKDKTHCKFSLVFYY